ncbi:MAG: DUF523 domain-containing protein [Bdellovibrionales bacterium]|nr:DUF523 domain-containing protein [Bdellovibrionales bacterium]
MAVSSCLLGEAVRYDGGHKKADNILSLRDQGFRLVSICPEMTIGLPSPRDPIDLVISESGVVTARKRADYSLEYTTPLQKAAQVFVRAHPYICGYIFKSKSPSCGLTDTQTHDVQGKEIGLGSGIFAQTVQLLAPGVPVIDETQFDDPFHRQSFIVSARSRSLSHP